jgi:hypothetical protein
MAAEALVWWRIAGAAARDALFGEAESPAHVAGALLATLQFSYLEGPALLLAIAGWWVSQVHGAPFGSAPCDGAGAGAFARRGARGVGGSVRWPDSMGWFGAAAASLPMFAVHQGTFVGVARPAEPFIAVFAVVGLAALARWVGSGPWVTLAKKASVREHCVAGWGTSPRGTAAGLRLGLVARRAVVVALAVLALCWAVGMSVPKLLERGTVDPDTVIARLQGTTAPDEPVLAPPYYAALAGRMMLFDYADWTVLGMRAAAGVPREEALAADLTGRLQARAIPLVAADFRLDYVAPVAAELRRSYVATGSDGDDPARSVTFWVPK